MVSNCWRFWEVPSRASTVVRVSDRWRPGTPPQSHSGGEGDNHDLTARDLGALKRSCVPHSMTATSRVSQAFFRQVALQHRILRCG